MDNNKIKKFYADSAEYILGERSRINISGTTKNKKLTKDLLVASKHLYESLNHPNTSLEDIIPLLSRKERLARKFEEVIGIPWTL